MRIFRSTFFTIAIIVAFLALTSAFTILLILINKNIIISSQNVDVFDLLLKVSFTLIGSTLSGLVAFLIYFLQDRRIKNEKSLVESQHLLMIKKEFDNNVAILSNVYEMYREGTIDELAALILKPESSIKETLSIYNNILDTSILKDSRSKVNEKEFIANIDNWNKVNLIHRNLDLLVSDITKKESAKTILEYIKREITVLLPK
ncbi:hypothetical protein [Paenibacillus oleatilyticus]|uniref:Uncharacterized protein n=1 Tax=Paenibacillus oleatilyticus TaxID=2594886 RepID=A0ABV4V1A9_9BACL